MNNKCLVLQVNFSFDCGLLKYVCTTGFSSEIGTKLSDWAVRQAWGSCYSRAALSSNDSKTGAPAWWGDGHFLDTFHQKVSIICPKYVQSLKYVQNVPKTCPILLKMSKKMSKGLVNFGNLTNRSESMSKYAWYAQNLSKQCPNLEYSLDTFCGFF